MVRITFPRFGRASAAALTASLLASVVGVAQAPLAPLALPPRTHADVEVCGTGVDRLEQLGFRPQVAPAVNEAISFVQDPPVVAPDYLGAITLRNFTVLGDVPVVRFRLLTGPMEVETWPRSSTTEIDGRLVSLFNPSWPARALDLALRGTRWGWDQPAIVWGEYLGVDQEPGTGDIVRLRIASTNLPQTQVVRLADDVQYSSHVVNLVMPEFGNGYLTDDHGFELTRAATAFYAHFEDTYDALAVVPQATYFPSYGAFHRNVQNLVRGIGLSVFNRSASYGSTTGRLRSVELYTGHRFGRHDSSSHEIAHQWGGYIDWARLTGLPRSGHQPSSHDPLWSGGETLIGSILNATRRARETATGWAIEQTAGPPRFHPFTRYAMGHLSKDEVPTITLFDEQAQFGADGPYGPDDGREIVGTTRTATVFNVIGMVGEREGPVDREWHRATIVVSRDRLLTPREMDYWTFFARRLEDSNRTGAVGYDGAGSFEVSTYGRIDLRTDVRPLNAPPAATSVGPDAPSFGRRDFRDVVFDTDVPTRIRAGEPLRLSGVITARDRSDFDEIGVRLWKSGGTASDRIYRSESVSDRTSFQFSVPTSIEQRGVYLFEVFLFWPGSGAQHSRVTMSPVVIE